jgi:hypothetical protein
MLPIVDVTVKPCNVCGLDLPASEFYKSEGYLFGTCKSCTSKKSKDRYRKNREVILSRAAKYREANRGVIRERQKHASRKYMYGLDRTAFEALLEAQQYLCPGCEVDLRTTQTDVDHDHSCCPGSRSCGRCVRGLLCHNCNVTLGMVNDSSETLRRLADYAESGVRA